MAPRTPLVVFSLLAALGACTNTASPPTIAPPQTPLPPHATPSKSPVPMGSMLPGRETTVPPLLASAAPKTNGDADLADRLAHQLIAASPIADPADAHARDQAADRLGAMADLASAAGEKILWGGYHPAQGYDPAAYRLTEESPIDYYQLTELSPTVWGRLYLSTFMFTGTYRVHSEGAFTVVDLDARFRDGLDSGDYPYPFWHNVNKWTAYCNAEKVALVFSGGRLLAGLRVAPPPLALSLKKRPWDQRWTWTDDQGRQQPRVALFSYMFAKDNPHVAPLDRAFRDLEQGLRSQNCVLCHTPDNQSHMNELLLLNYPNQALVARHSIKDVIANNAMPPGNRLAHEPTGIQDEAARARLLRLAAAFEEEADRAFAYEKGDFRVP